MKEKIKWYVAKRPGYSMSLPDGLIYKELIGGVTRERTVLTFHANAGKMVKTSQPEIQKALEGSVAFKRGLITRVPTPEEIAARKKREEQEHSLGVYIGLVDKGHVIDFKAMTDTNLRLVADEVGAETSKDGKKLSKEVIAGNIEVLVYGKVLKE